MGVQRADEAPDFLFPASHMTTPASTFSVPAGTAVITIPAGVLGPNAVQLPVNTPAQNIDIPSQDVSIPAQDVKLMDRDSLLGSLNATLLVYDGGMRRGYREQTQGLVDMMKEEAKRTDLEIVDSVTRYYYGSILAQQVHQLGIDTLARMEATLELTESMYKEGSGRVKKTDFLDNKVMVETLRAMVAQLEKNEAMAKAALANSVGLPWNASVRPRETEISHHPFQLKLEDVVSASYEFSPDWGKVEAGLRATEGSLRTANSEYFPKLALTGELHKLWNSYSAGVVTDRNREGWTVGVGLEIPIFSGFQTRNKVAETRARIARIKEEQILLKDGLALQIKELFLSLSAVDKSERATLEAMNAAIENRDLNTRAYQNELVDTEKVIRAQLMEALMSAQHFKTRYDSLALQSQLNVLVGTEVLNHLK